MPTWIDPHSAPVTPAERCALEPKWGCNRSSIPGHGMGEILSTDGGYRAADAYEVFPRVVKAPDGSFKSRFFLHGWRHVDPDAKHRLESLTAGEELYVTLELANPATRVAVQIQTTDYQMIGWAPRYLVRELAKAMAEKSRDYSSEFSSKCEASGTAASRWRATTTGVWWWTESGRMVQLDAVHAPKASKSTTRPLCANET